MSVDEPDVELALIVSELDTLSFVASRDLRAAMPAIVPFGAAATALWARTGRDLFLHDRDAGKAFLRASRRLATETGEVRAWTEQARGFLGFRGSWKALTAYLAHFGEAQAVLGLAAALRWGEIGLSWARVHLDSGEVYFSTPLHDLTAGRGWTGLTEIVTPLTALNADRGLPAGLALAGALQVRRALGAAAVEPWARRGADILQSGRLRGEAFFRLEGVDSDEALRAGLPGFRTHEHERLLTLLTQAVLGMSPPLVPGDLNLGAPPFIETDGRALFVPPAFPDRTQALAAILHHTGHLVYGSYALAPLTVLFQDVGIDHPPLDSDQCMTWHPLFSAFGDDRVRFQLLFDLCEDFRIDARIQQRLPNYAPRLLALASSPPTGAAGDYYAQAVASLEMIVGRRPLSEPWATLAAADADLVTAWRCARAWYKEVSLPPVTPAEQALAYIPGRSPHSRRPIYPRATLATAGPEPEGGDGAAAPVAARESPAVTGHDPDQEIQREDTRGSGGRVGVGRPQPSAAPRGPRRLRPPGAGIPYAEWDYRAKAYRRDWTRVMERSLTDSDSATALSLLARHAGVLRRLRRAIQAQKPQRPLPRRRQPDGDELDLDATVDYVVDRHTGACPSGAIYRQRRRAVRDTTVLLLADLSTSIMQQAADGDGRVVDRLKAALLMFAASLEEVGDTYAIAGFASKYRDAVSYYPIKEFTERLNSRHQALLGGLSGRLATRMGAAIRHACTRLAAAGHGQRLLLILSDGRPGDYDDGGDERYLHEDTRVAIKEAADQGIHAFCVTLDPAGGSYLERIFGRGHYLVIDTLNDLPARLPQIYLRLRCA
ncbi:MAG: nitric oxide reductase activation protein NorD [Acidiferrobacter sp.]